MEGGNQELTSLLNSIYIVVYSAADMKNLINKKNILLSVFLM